MGNPAAEVHFDNDWARLRNCGEAQAQDQSKSNQSLHVLYIARLPFSANCKSLPVSCRAFETAVNAGVTAIPRNGAGTYTLPAGYLAETGELIVADQHNDPLEDIKDDLNAARPIVAGGTGATTASGARTALSVYSQAESNAAYVKRVSSKTALKALDTALYKVAFLEASPQKLYTYTLGDFTDETAADPSQDTYIPADGISVSIGVWVAVTGAGAAIAPISSGGTGASTAADARANLGIGTAGTATLIDDDTFATATATNIPSAESVKAYADTKQAASANLTTLAAVTPGATGLALLDDTTAAAARTTISAQESSANLTTVAGDIEHIRSMTWYGTVDKTGVSSSQTAIDAALAAANTGGFGLFLPAGTYLTTASIPNLHDVVKRGAGVIKRGSNLFYVEPKQDATNTLYLNASTGSDTNDGLSSSEPLATLERASEVISKYGNTACKWVIELAAGTYAGAIFTRDFVTGNGAGLLTIQGPTVSVAQNASVAFVMLEQGASGTFQVGETITFSTSSATATVTAVDGRKVVATITSVAIPVVGQTATGGTSGATAVTGYQSAVPTAVIDQAQDLGQSNGLTLGWLQQIQVTNIKTKGFTTAESAGINVSRFSDIRLTNVHDEGSYYGYSFINNVTYTASNGILEDNLHSGIIEYFNVVRSIASTGLLIFNAATNGVYSKEQTTGHGDSLVIDTVGKTGLLLLTGGTMNVDGLTLRNCPIGITASHYELHEESDINWGTGSDACTRAFNLGPHVTRLSTSGWAGDPATYRSHPTPAPWFSDFTTNTYNSTATNTTVLGTLYANEHATKGQSIKVRVSGRRTTGSNGTLTIRLTMASFTMCSAVLPTTATGTAYFHAELEILCYADGDFQRCSAWAIQEGNTFEGQYIDQTRGWSSSDQILRLEVVQSSASDTTVVNDVRVWA